MRKLPRLVAETKVNSNSNVTIWRNEKKKSLNVVIAEMKEEKKKFKKVKIIRSQIHCRVIILSD